MGLIAGLACLGVLIGPASATTSSSRWTMDAVGGVVTDKLAASDISLWGPWREVPGAVGRGIRFDYADGASLGTASNSGRFNPGSDTFAVSAYLKSESVPTDRRYSPNVAQKGLYADAGQWKLALAGTTRGTVASCRFVGSRGADMVTDRTSTALDDGRWHEVTCWRFPASYGIAVDGTNTTVTGTVGFIANSRPLRIGTKTRGAGIGDQFQGVLDCVVYVGGAHARSTAEANAPC